MLVLTGALALTLATTAPAPALAEGDAWVADFDKAIALAKEQQKDLLVDFTGSDWCGWCIKLKEEVFDHDEFLDAAQKDFVLVYLDFPRSQEAKAKVPDPERNNELRQKYQIRGYPTVLLMTPEGEVFGQTGYKAGGPEPYVAHLAEMRASGKRALEEVRALAEDVRKAEGEERAGPIGKVLDRMESMEAGAAGLLMLADAARVAFELDAEKHSKLQLRALELLLDKGAYDSSLLPHVKRLDPKNEKGLYAEAVDLELQNASEETVGDVARTMEEFLAAVELEDQKKAFQYHWTLANIYYSYLDDIAKAKVHAQKAKDIGTDQEEFLELMNRILEARD